MGRAPLEIRDAADVDAMVRTFYEKVYSDERLRPIFVDVAGVHMEEHLETMNRFWQAILLGKPGYRGNPREKHAMLHRQTPLNEDLFEHWLALFEQNLEDNFSGPLALKAITVARVIARNLHASVHGFLPG